MILCTCKQDTATDGYIMKNLKYNLKDFDNETSDYLHFSVTDGDHIVTVTTNKNGKGRFFDLENGEQLQIYGTDQFEVHLNSKQALRNDLRRIFMEETID